MIRKTAFPLATHAGPFRPCTTAYDIFFRGVGGRFINDIENIKLNERI
jgi:hypothetical protein